MWIWRVDHDKKKLLEQRRSPHHTSIFNQLFVVMYIISKTDKQGNENQSTKQIVEKLAFSRQIDSAHDNT